jgi:hypothetical protein
MSAQARPQSQEYDCLRAALASAAERAHNRTAAVWGARWNKVDVGVWERKGEHRMCSTSVQRPSSCPRPHPPPPPTPPPLPLSAGGGQPAR